MTDSQSKQIDATVNEWLSKQAQMHRDCQNFVDAITGTTSADSMLDVRSKAWETVESMMWNDVIRSKAQVDNWRTGGEVEQEDMPSPEARKVRTAQTKDLMETAVDRMSAADFDGMFSALSENIVSTTGTFLANVWNENAGYPKYDHIIHGNQVAATEPWMDKYKGKFVSKALWDPYGATMPKPYKKLRKAAKDETRGNLEDYIEFLHGLEVEDRTPPGGPGPQAA